MSKIDKLDKQVDEVLELDRLSDLLREVSEVNLEEVTLDPIQAHFNRRATEYMEARVRSAQRAKKKGKKLKPDGRKFRKKLHWKTRAKRERERYHNVIYPRYLRKQAQVVHENGWYDIMRRGWENWGWTVMITREEWDTHIEPLLHTKGCNGTETCKGCRVPYTERYNTSNPVVSLKDIMIFDKNETGRLKKPLFDGAEFYLKQQGYSL